MTITEKQAATLPKELRTAQEAIQLPEVQEMMRKLSVYNLGVFMPHMHEKFCYSEAGRKRVGRPSTASKIAERGQPQ
jgi:hypothetical protein